MAKTKIRVNEAWSEWLSSTRYDRGEIGRRLDAFAADPDWDTARPLQRVGAALRVESPARAREAIDRILGDLDWGAIRRAQDHDWAFFSWSLAPLAHAKHRLGYSAPLRLAIQDLLSVVRAAKRWDANTARSVVAHLEFDDADAGTTLRGWLAETDPWDLLRGFDSADDIKDRQYALLSSRFGDTAAEIRFLAERGFCTYGVLPTAARAIAQRHALGPVGPGANCELGYGRSGWAYEARPFLEVVGRFDRALFHEILPGVLANSSISAERTIDMLDFLPWDEDLEIWGEGQSFRCRRLGALVFSWGGKHGKKGTANAKLHKSEAKATADLRSKLAAKQTALAAAPTAPTLHEADPPRALHEAARRGHRHQVRSLLRHQVAPEAFVDERGRTALHLACQDDPEIVRLLLEAGADPDARSTDGATPLTLVAGEELRGPHVLDSARHLVAAGATGGRLQGLTALQSAACAGQAEIVELLLQYGADVSARAEAPSEHAGKTALELARAGEHHATARIIELAGG